MRVKRIEEVDKIIRIVLFSNEIKGKQAFKIAAILTKRLDTLYSTHLNKAIGKNEFDFSEKIDRTKATVEIMKILNRNNLRAEIRKRWEESK